MAEYFWICPFTYARSADEVVAAVCDSCPPNAALPPSIAAQTRAVPATASRLRDMSCLLSIPWCELALTDDGSSGGTSPRSLSHVYAGCPSPGPCGGDLFQLEQDLARALD